MIDCHCHLCDDDFVNAGVRACFVNTECCSEFQRALDLAEAFPGFCLPCFGIHPVQYDITNEGPVPRSVAVTDLEGVDDWFSAHHQKLVAVGEVGLDFTPRYIRAESDKDAQKTVLSHHIDLANKYDLPLIAHSRSSGKPIINFLLENGVKRVLLHAFDGNYKSAQPGIDAGFYFSIPPSVIRSEQKQSLISKVPLEQLLLETDSPVLGPSKDERNEPKNLQISCEFIARIKNVDVEFVKKVTSENAVKLFPRLKLFIK